MADDGLLLNFDLDANAVIKPRVKVTGGSWRDRKHAERVAKRRLEKAPAPAQATTKAEDEAPFPDSRPKKRLRTENGPGPAPSANKGGHGLTSRLFTSNPIPKTTFYDTPEEPAEPIAPSNAPLSAEAANFHALGLSRRLAEHLSSKLQMSAPMAIQKSTIPQLVKEDSDAFIQAETGSGKTLAYLLPIIHRIVALSQNEDGTRKDVKIHRNSGLFAIIMAPTRELCKQIGKVLEKILRCAPWIVGTVVIGGENSHSEKARIRKGVNIMVATPGRLSDHLENTKALDVGQVRWLILDEGDMLMELGFEEDVKKVVGKIRSQAVKAETSDGVPLGHALPARRVTVLCSATMKMNVQRLGEISLEGAVHITAAKNDQDEDKSKASEAAFTAPAQLKQSFVVTPAKVRLVTLISLLKSTFERKGSLMKAIIFMSCADSVDLHFDLLKSQTPDNTIVPEGFSTTEPLPTAANASYIMSPANPTIHVYKLYGSLSPTSLRSQTLDMFKKDKAPSLLITTDLMGRGLDIPAVDLVIEYDPAASVATHLHRIGRTARAGRAGKAVLFLLPGCEEGYISILQFSSTITPQSYETVLQKGLASGIEQLVEESATASNRRGKQTWSTRAEDLQLHLEQRLLKDNNLLESARKGFKSHIRAYMTHVREEREFFDSAQLHKGHLAKSFGLREPPGGLGRGPQPRKIAPGQKGSGSKGAKMKKDGDATGRQMDVEDAARRMKAALAAMNPANEFNIG